MDRLIETSVGRGMNSITVGQCAFTDLDFADDVSLLADVLELLVPAVEIFREAATPLGLELTENNVPSLQAFASVNTIPTCGVICLPRSYMIHLSCNRDTHAQCHDTISNAES